MKKIIAIGLIIAILVMGYVYVFVYNKSHTDYSNAKPEFELKAETLYNDFTNSKDSKKYLGKVVMISGIVSSVESIDKLTVVSFNFEEGIFGNQGVRCSMLTPNISIKKTGKEILIKGFCSGYNDTDVLLEYCTIIKD